MPKELQLIITPEIAALINTGSPVAIGVSGGKDSQALAFRVSEYLDEVGHNGPRVLIHSDLGRIEWRDSLSVCQRIADRLNMKLVVVRRKSGDLISRWQARWENNVKRYLDLSCVKLILPWSTPSMRFCTSELKIALICQYLKSLFPGTPIISSSGVRAEESATRAKLPAASLQPRLKNKGTDGWDWRPILHWSKKDVLSYIASKGERLHEAYSHFGCSRVSCAFCIMSSASDLQGATTCPDNEDVYRLLVDIEIRSTFAFQDSRWLGDVASYLLSAEAREALADTKLRALRRIEAEKQMPDSLLYMKGWPTALPTFKEAQLLADIRQVVCDTIGVKATFVTAEDIIARYQELLDAKQVKIKNKLLLAA